MQHSLRDMPVLAVIMLCIIVLVHAQSLPEFFTPAPSDIDNICSDPARAQNQEPLAPAPSDIDSICSYFADVQSQKGLVTLMILIMEVFLAIMIIYFVHWYTQNSDYARKSRQGEIRLEAKRIDRSKRAGEARAVRAMCASASSLADCCTILATMGSRSAEVPGQAWPRFRDDLGVLHCHAARLAGELRRMLEDAGCPDDRTRDDVLAVIDRLGNAAAVDDGERAVDVQRYRAALDLLGPALDRLRRRLARASARPRPAWPDKEPRALVLSLDRYTCPPGAAIRARVEADGRFPSGWVAVSILDGSPGTPAKRTEVAPTPEPGRNAALDVTLIPRKNLCAGRVYIVRAECSGQADEAALVVDNVAPAVRPGGLTCTVGNCIDIAVEDPAAATGGAARGPGWTAKGPQLVVESPHERTVVECSLGKDGASAGTFRCRVRCVATRDAAAAAGSSRSAWAGREGAEDAYIACEPNQLVRIRYESTAGEAWTAVLVEGPDAAEPGRPSDGGGGGGGPGLPSGKGCGGGDGGGRSDAGPEPCGREEGRAGRIRGGPEGDGGRGQ